MAATSLVVLIVGGEETAVETMKVAAEEVAVVIGGEENLNSFFGQSKNQKRGNNKANI